MTSLPSCFVKCCLAAWLLLAYANSARAEAALALGLASADQYPLTQAPGVAAQPVPVITAEQFNAFADLIGEPRPVVWQRLHLDPGLVPFAVAAADARMSRKSSGKIRTAIGFSIFGVGGITGYVIMLSGIGINCGYNEDTCGNEVASRMLLGLVIMAVSAGVGLGIGIPGIVSMVRQSSAETTAVERYQYPQVPMPPPSYWPGYSMTPAGHSLKVPLLAFSF